MCLFSCAYLQCTGCNSVAAVLSLQTLTTPAIYKEQHQRAQQLASMLCSEGLAYDSMKTVPSDYAPCFD